MKLPREHEAHVVPRSSTFKNWGIIQTNGMGIIDNSYCGDNDIWGMPVYATRDTVINVNDRICQFRIMRSMPALKVIEVENLGEGNRGGFGSTGKKLMRLNSGLIELGCCFCKRNHSPIL